MAWNEEVKSENLIAIVDAVADGIAAVVGPPKTLSVLNDTVEQGFYAATTLSAVDADLTAANIKKNVVMFGITGTYDNSAVPITAATVKTGLEGFVNGAKVTGSGTQTLDTSGELAAGYYEHVHLDAIDTDLASVNIKSGITIFGKSGAATVQDIADADLTAAEAPTGKKFYAATGAVKTGTGTKSLSNVNSTVDAGYYEATTLETVDTDLVVTKIKAGVTIFGKLGTYETVITGDAVVTDVKAGKFFYKDDATDKLEGTLVTVALDPASGAYPAGYHAGNVGGLVAVEAQLVTGNIKAGINIFGVDGKTEVVDTTSGDAVAANILTTKKAWVDGVEITGNVPAGANCNGADKSLAVTITDGLYSGSKTATAADALLIPGNIKTGVSIFGVAGDFTSNGEVKATGTITSSGDGAEVANTILIDAKTYTFVDPIGVTEGNVLVGSTPAESLDNLKAAINKGDGGGTVYICTAAHPTVEATTNTDTVQTLQALTAGHAGNVTLTIVADHLAASGAALTGGLSAAVAGDIATGHFAWVNGVKIEGTA